MEANVAGHSKWAQIKRKKAVTDARRGKLWSKLLKEVSVAARLGGDDPGGNARLRTAIQDARAANVPNDNIDRAVKRGSDQLDGVTYEEVTYEGYGGGGVAVLIETLTDNRNRTVSDVRHLFSKHGGNLGESGCVSWMFDKRGYFAIGRTEMTEESFMELALDLGAEDISIEEEFFEIYSRPEDYLTIREALKERGVALEASQLTMMPQSTVRLETGTAGKVLRLIEALEDHDDVQHVWANFDVDEEFLAVQSG
jgi:YebC/PmpR family DNA-binding regulatory protein